MAFHGSSMSPCVVVTSDYRGAPERRGTVGDNPKVPPE
jgi:hypothetical protein